MFAHLIVFHNNHGHCTVPSDVLVDGLSLANWVNTQRRIYRKSIRQGKSLEKIERLRAVGFDFEPLKSRKRRWEEEGGDESCSSTENKKPAAKKRAG
jgi:hypothetical protein